MPYFPGLSPIQLDKINRSIGMNHAPDATATLSILGDKSTSPLQVQNDRPNTAVSTVVQLYKHRTNGMGAAGMGAGFSLATDNDAGQRTAIGQVVAIMENAAAGAEYSYFAVRVVVNGAFGAPTESFRVNSTGMEIWGDGNITSRLSLPAGTTAIAPLRIRHGVAPTSPNDGDIWTTTAGLYVRINGVTVGPLS